jgi:hypothetical protein
LGVLWILFGHAGKGADAILIQRHGLAARRGALSRGRLRLGYGSRDRHRAPGLLAPEDPAHDDAKQHAGHSEND